MTWSILASRMPTTAIVESERPMYATSCFGWTTIAVGEPVKGKIPVMSPVFGSAKASAFVAGSVITKAGSVGRMSRIAPTGFSTDIGRFNFSVRDSEGSVARKLREVGGSER